MATLSSLLGDLAGGRVSVLDLTAPLSERTPVIQLPPPFVHTAGFSLQQISRYDEAGPAWYWNNIAMGEHAGTHLDAPVHWISGRDGLDVSQIPLHHLVAPAVVVDMSAECRENPDFLLEVRHLEEWQSRHGPLPAGGWLLYRTGWDSRAGDQEAFLNADETGPHTPGLSVECARWLAESAPIIGLGVETVGTDAGAAHSFDPPFPCHSFLLGAGKYGLTQLANLALLPSSGIVLLVAPLPITGGSGSPARVLALVEP
jgi:kynurenine formamidase